VDSPTADQAAAAAYREHGRPVFKVERVAA
jgi:hypothetical protein